LKAVYSGPGGLIVYLNGDRGREEDLEGRIMKLETEQRSLEKGIDEAYRRGDYRRGSRLSKNLEKFTVMIERVYEEWGGA